MSPSSTPSLWSGLTPDQFCPSVTFVEKFLSGSYGTNGNGTVVDSQRRGKVPLLGCYVFNGGRRIFKNVLDGELNVH